MRLAASSPSSAARCANTRARSQASSPPSFAVIHHRALVAGVARYGYSAVLATSASSAGTLRGAAGRLASGPSLLPGNGITTDILFSSLAALATCRGRQAGIKAPWSFSVDHALHCFGFDIPTPEVSYQN